MQELSIDINDLIEKYKECPNLHKLASFYHTSHIKLSNMLKDANYPIQRIGKARVLNEEEIQQAIEEYADGMSMEEVSKKFHIRIKKLRGIFRDKGVKIGKWRNHESKPKVVKEKSQKEEYKGEYKVCPYCGWKTKDIDNKSKAYPKHLWYGHHIDVDKHLELYPEDKVYEPTLSNYRDLICCKVCGKYVKLIDNRHLAKHNMTKQEYMELYHDAPMISDKTKEKLHSCYELMMNNQDWNRKSSSYEQNIKEFLREYDIEVIEHDRTILKSQELDLLIPSHNVAIEINGNRWHSEWFGGKDSHYHLNKTLQCNEVGVKLIHIFEDEIVSKKNIVYKKLQHILGLQQDLPKIMGRKCVIEQIEPHIAEMFLNEYHIQGYATSTIHLGASYNNRLIGVMSFKVVNKNDSTWELTRFASDYNVICQGIGGKLFKYFVKEFNPKQVKSFADRRWTIDYDNNLYINLGFECDGFVKPDYKYYNPSIDHLKRFHKFNFRKQILMKKYGFSENMTETEMVKELGYDRIWNCGLIRYIWRK